MAKKKLNKEDKCDIPNATGEDLNMVSLAKRIDRDLARGHKVQLVFPFFSFGLGNVKAFPSKLQLITQGTVRIPLMSLPKLR